MKGGDGARIYRDHLHKRGGRTWRDIAKSQKGLRVCFRHRQKAGNLFVAHEAQALREPQRSPVNLQFALFASWPKLSDVYDAPG